MTVSHLIPTLAAAIGAVPISGGTNSPLGRFSGAITAGVTVMALAFAFLTHVGAFGWQADPFIDLVASIAVGVVFGRGVGITEGATQISATLAERGNLNTSLALAAHDRLDRINAPAVPLDHSGTSIGTQVPGQES
jgi:hypothetical protein